MYSVQRYISGAVYGKQTVDFAVRLTAVLNVPIGGRVWPVIWRLRFSQKSRRCGTYPPRCG